jgi:predicted RNA-binding protein with PUA-like domain
MTSPSIWLVKSEPSTYSFAQLKKDKRTAWTGVRNYQARNHLRAMRPGDRVLFYHSMTEKQLVGLATVVSEPGPDPTAPGEDWASVDLAPLFSFPKPVTLAQLKQLPGLAGLSMLVQPRLSVTKVTKAQLERVLKLSGSPSLGPPAAKKAQ